ncbi:hypothetical protein ILYODFUR_022698, partial [Ilyodon furcidens]
MKLPSMRYHSQAGATFCSLAKQDDLAASSTLREVNIALELVSITDWDFSFGLERPCRLGYSGLIVGFYLLRSYFHLFLLLAVQANCEAMSQAAVSKRTDHTITSGVMEESEVCSLPGGPTREMSTSEVTVSSGSRQVVPGSQQLNFQETMVCITFSNNVYILQ